MLLDANNNMVKITKIEQEIIDKLIEGKTIPTIAEETKIRVGTVYVHIKRLKDKYIESYKYLKVMNKYLQFRSVAGYVKVRAKELKTE